METLRKIKNWLLPVLITLGGVLDYSMDLLPQLVEYFNIKPEIATYLRLAIFVVSSAILKLQSPTKNPAKLKSLAKKLEKQKKEDLANK